MRKFGKTSIYLVILAGSFMLAAKDSKLYTAVEYSQLDIAKKLLQDRLLSEKEKNDLLSFAEIIVKERERKSALLTDGDMFGLLGLAIGSYFAWEVSSTVIYNFYKCHRGDPEYSNFHDLTKNISHRSTLGFALVLGLALVKAHMLNRACQKLQDAQAIKQLIQAIVPLT